MIERKLMFVVRRASVCPDELLRDVGLEQLIGRRRRNTVFVECTRQQVGADHAPTSMLRYQAHKSIIVNVIGAVDGQVHEHQLPVRFINQGTEVALIEAETFLRAFPACRRS